MFPDSSIASKFSLSETKARYIITFGLGSCFLDMLKQSAHAADNFVLLFDESLNGELQKKQLDMHVRFWSDGVVSSRYFGSSFMGHATAEDLESQIMKQLEVLELKKVLQLSMDGQNVNHKLHNLIDNQMKNDHGCSLLNVGSCGLHTVHNAFKAGHAASGWDLDKWMSSMHWLFHDSPARREDLLKYTGAEYFPAHFCGHRWLENMPVAERALELWPNIKEFIHAVKGGKVPYPKNRSFKTLQECAEDPLFEAKVHAFISVARVVTPFLRKFQSDAPLLPYLCSDLQSMIKRLLARFITPDTLDGLGTMAKLASLNLTDKSFLLSLNKVDVGYMARTVIKKQLADKKASALQVLTFKTQARDFMQAVVQKLLTRALSGMSLVGT
ncbi:uncharacterized protein LOC125179270 [Hyalella azteca]|uniref:Uncharacterized protein LOC125179270 n=1 Tax=Hyalella azteca TaxID=294128 RepID=A0A979FU94_HYAAZ|nr:uncharacterized protein LOC125179270 [Hyalella azteca]